MVNAGCPKNLSQLYKRLFCEQLEITLSLILFALMAFIAILKRLSPWIR